ncbi:low molecular weight phosphatase family protein [Cellulomonas sp. DKR-3]|uniref:Low molecular weight phosphatase family protein n=1 Tax=Cellulomonas fulva TaxID=2835530 RepID=A0ABS5TVC5_9CELL|nr:low molecular weight phosphatase family protein [Cellulomonas fulva]MBT0993098.1 low molecular weight phosphatase family protein [Cellulomonas fulva]
MRVLAVCTGNICRSPAVERLLAHALAAAGAGDDVVVASAGTAAVVGAPVSAEMVRLLDDAGVPSGAFAARQVTQDELRRADLVLAATREHRRALVQLEPSVVRRTFTLRELARVVGTIDAADLPGTDVAGRLAALVALAARRRGLAPAAAAADDDVADPYGRGADAYRASFDEIRPAVDAIVHAARPA